MGREYFFQYSTAGKSFQFLFLLKKIFMKSDDRAGGICYNKGVSGPRRRRCLPGPLTDKQEVTDYEICWY
jgi:hypothetical protein